MSQRQHFIILIYSFASILVLHPCCPQQPQVSFNIAEGLLQSILPLLQCSASGIEAPVHINVLLWAKVATRNHQGPQSSLRWEEDGPIGMETSACERDKRKYEVNKNMIYVHVRKTKKEQEIKRNRAERNPKTIYHSWAWLPKTSLRARWPQIIQNTD